MIRPAGGALLSLAGGNLSKARYHWSIFTGRTGGWFLTPQRVRPQRRMTELISRGEDLQ
jgi:hypothetical protein